MSNPLDTLASEAVVHQNGEGDQEPPQEAATTIVNNNKLDSSSSQLQQQQPLDDDNTPLSVEESAGGPPMPPAGQQAAALKEAIGAVPPADDHIHLQSPPTEPAVLSLGHGDAAMAAIDTRLDEDAPVPHTNGYLEQGLPSTGSNGVEEAEQAQPNELDYQRVVEVANSTSQDVQEGQSGQAEHIPPMSMDVEHPQGLEEPELPLPIAESVESANEARLAVDSLSGDPSTSETLGEATLPAPGADNAQPLESVEAEQPQVAIASATAAAASLEAAVPSEQEQAQAGEFSLASLPDEPTPLPSQLVNATAPTTDATQSLPPLPSTEQPASSSEQQAQISITSSDAQQQPQILENGSTIPSSASEEQPRAPNAPPSSLSNLLDSSAPTPEPPTPSSFAPIPSPSLAKRPFEDDTTTSSSAAQATAEANYFGTGSGEGESSEPSSKRQRVSPEAMSQPGTGAASPAMQVDDVKPSIQQQPQEGQTTSAAASAVDADGEADAEGDSDQANKTEPSADASMIDQSLDLSMVSCRDLLNRGLLLGS